MTKPLKSLKWEIEHLGTGRAPSESTPEAATYCARVIEADLRKAEAFAHVHPEMDPLQRARSLLSRGLVADAREILVKLRTNANEEGNGSSHNDLLAEVALEEARCASFEGHWQESLEWIERAFTYGPTGVSQMTLRQVRAVALMELGRLSEALSEVELAQSLARLFPKTNLSLYVTATQIKIWIFAGEAARARSRLDGLWEKIKIDSTTNLDTVVLLLRLEIELRRQTQTPYAALAFATWALTRAAGDGVYEALALLDFFFALPLAERAPWQAALDQAQSQYAKIKGFLSGLAREPSNEQTIEDAHTCLSIEALKRSCVESGVTFNPGSAEGLKHITFFGKQAFSVDLTSLQVRFTEPSPQFTLALRALSQGPITKDQFFKSVWGDQKFVPALHDPVIRRLLYRLRKQSGLSLTMARSRITLNDLLAVEV